MSLKSEIRLIVPPEWAYGEKGKDEIIPPNSELLFYIELLKFKDKEVEPPMVKKELIIEQTSLYDFNAGDLYKQNISFADYRENFLLIVNIDRKYMSMD